MPIEFNFEVGACAVCRRREVVRWCDFITEYNHSILFVRDRIRFNEVNERGAQYETCDLPMCEACAFEVSYDTHMCPHHFALLQKSELPNAHQKKRQAEERGRIYSNLTKWKSEGFHED